MKVDSPDGNFITDQKYVCFLAWHCLTANLRMMQVHIREKSLKKVCFPGNIMCRQHNIHPSTSVCRSGKLIIQSPTSCRNVHLKKFNQRGFRETQEFYIHSQLDFKSTSKSMFTVLLDVDFLSVWLEEWTPLERNQFMALIPWDKWCHASFKTCGKKTHLHHPWSSWGIDWKATTMTPDPCYYLSAGVGERFSWQILVLTANASSPCSLLHTRDWVVEIIMVD